MRRGSTWGELTCVAAVAAATAWSSPAAAHAPGDAVITEILVAPPTDGSSFREWFEVFVVTTVDLRGCELLRSPTGDPADAEASHLIEDVGVVWADEYLLFARDEEWVVGDGSHPGDLAAVDDYDYYLSFSNTAPFHLLIACDGVVLDGIEMDWTVFADDCPGNGCTVQLRPARLDAAANDAFPDAWCLPPADAAFVNSSGDTVWGTPGAASVCRGERWPAPGEVAIHEIADRPRIGRRWIELRSATEVPLWLEGCALETDDGRTATLTSGGEEALRIAGEALALLSGDGCIDPADDERDACGWGETPIAGLPLDGGAQHAWALRCPEVDGGALREVDTIEALADALEPADGRSLQLAPDDDEAEAARNDDPLAWCVADDDCYLAADGGDCDRGTPGEDNRCPAPADEDDGAEGCDCDAGGRGRPATLAALAAATLAYTRRRRRERAPTGDRDDG